MRKKGLVERIVMSEPAGEDFSHAKFPDNRAKLFTYMLKNKSFKIYKNHLLMALFFLPLIVWSVLCMGYSDWIFSLDPKEGIAHFVEYWFTVYVSEIPLWSIAFVGLAGGLNVIRKLAWSDPVILKTDFFGGIRASGKQLGLVGLLWGIIFAIIRYAIDWLGFYYQVFDGSYTVAFGIFVCILLLVFAVGYTVYVVCMSSLYNVTFKQLLIGAFKLYFADLFLATGVILASLLPLALVIVSDLAILVLIGYLLLLVLFIGIMIIPPFLVCHHTFDRIINKKDYPDYYGRGLSYGVYKESEAPMSIVEDNENESHTEELENDFERVNDDEN